jgi:predicted TIM-barrel fold metal-dependent hydrolase
MEKYDIHLHLTLEQYPPFEGMHVSSAENMLPHLKELGIKKGVLMSTGEGSMIPLGTNEECEKIAEKFPEHYAWMCNVDAVKPETLRERLQKYKEAGAVGVGEVILGQRMDSAFMQVLFAAAQETKLPILMHLSPDEREGYGVVELPGLLLLRQTLEKYPDLVVIGHSQPFWHEISKDASEEADARNQWGSGPVIPGGILPKLLDEYPNLYCDLSANSGGCALMRDPSFGIDFLKKYHDRLLFGTDMTNTDMTFPLGNWIEEQCEKGMLSREICEQIFVENARKILHI